MGSCHSYETYSSCKKCKFAFKNVFTFFQHLFYLQLGIDAQTIGVISPYRAQVHLLRKLLSNDIEVNTVDQYQGRDKSIIIYSCSKSLPKNSTVVVSSIFQ